MFSSNTTSCIIYYSCVWWGTF